MNPDLQVFMSGSVMRARGATGDGHNVRAEIHDAFHNATIYKNYGVYDMGRGEKTPRPYPEMLAASEFCFAPPGQHGGAVGSR